MLLLLSVYGTPEKIELCFIVVRVQESPQPTYGHLRQGHVGNKTQLYIISIIQQILIQSLFAKNSFI